MRRIVVTVAVAITAVLAAAPVAAANRIGTGFIGLTPAHATFTEEKSPPDQAIIDEAARLVDLAVPGSWIYVDLHKLDDGNAFEQALWRATDRGVKVGVIFGGDNPHLDDWHARSRGNGFLKQCKNCISSHTGAEMHAKFMLFSGLDADGNGIADLENVVWVTSANMTERTGAEPYNNALTLFGAPDLYNKLKRVWNDQWSPTTWADYYHPPSGRGHFQTQQNSFGFISPDTDPGDMWSDRLADVRTPSQGGLSCEVLVMHMALDPSDLRPSVIDELVRIRNGGCWVEVLVGLHPDGSGRPYIGTNALYRLSCVRIPVRKKRIHDKTVIYNASPHPGALQMTNIITGSHNVTKPALRYNDEVMLRFFDGPTMYPHYRGHFYDAWNSAETVDRTC